jgi:5,10-methenyltetrahydromethanopterin hydrogenase
MKTVTRLLGAPAKTAEKLFTAALKQQAAVMARKGIPAAVIERETRALESAIRTELWRQILLRPGDGVA